MTDLQAEVVTTLPRTEQCFHHCFALQCCNVCIHCGARATSWPHLQHGQARSEGGVVVFVPGVDEHHAQRVAVVRAEREEDDQDAYAAGDLDPPGAAALKERELVPDPHLHSGESSV